MKTNFKNRFKNFWENNKATIVIVGGLSLLAVGSCAIAYHDGRETGRDEGVMLGLHMGEELEKKTFDLVCEHNPAIRGEVGKALEKMKGTDWEITATGQFD